MGVFKKASKYRKPLSELKIKEDLLNQELKRTGMLSEKMTTSKMYYDVASQTPAVEAILSDVPDVGNVRANGRGNAPDIDPSDPSTWANGGKDMSWLKNPNTLEVLNGDDVTGQNIFDTPDLTGFKGLLSDPEDDTSDMLSYGGIARTGMLGVWGTSYGVLGGPGGFTVVLAAFGWPQGGSNPSDRGYGGFYRTDDDATYAARLRMKAKVMSYGDAWNDANNWKNAKSWIPFNSYGAGSSYSNYNGIKKEGNETDPAQIYVDVGMFTGSAGKYESTVATPKSIILRANEGLGDPGFFPGPIQSWLMNRLKLAKQGSQYLLDKVKGKIDAWDDKTDFFFKAGQGINKDVTLVADILWDLVPEKGKNAILGVANKLIDKVEDAILPYIKDNYGDQAGGADTSRNWMEEYSKRSYDNQDGFTENQDLTDVTSDELKNSIKDGVAENLKKYDPILRNSDGSYDKDKLRNEINDSIEDSKGFDGNNSMGKQPGSGWVTEENIDHYLETGELIISKGTEDGSDTGYQFRRKQSDDAVVNFVSGLLDFNADTTASASGGLKGVAEMVGSITAAKLNLRTKTKENSTGSAAQDLEETPPMPWEFRVDAGKPGSKNKNESFIMESRKKKFKEPEWGLSELLGFDGGGDTKNVKESYLSEGWQSPEHVNVDKDERKRWFKEKDIQPEYPKKAPPKQVNGWHPSLVDKPIDNPTIKITDEELIRNHRLTDKEVKEWKDTINALNAYIDAHPEELIHARQRYPVSDPRLAELNWKMDTMLGATEEFLDKKYPENTRLFTQLQKSVKRSIKLTDPTTFKVKLGKETSYKKLLNVDYITHAYSPTAQKEIKVKVKQDKDKKKTAARFFRKERKKSKSEILDLRIKQLDIDMSKTLTNP